LKLDGSLIEAGNIVVIEIAIPAAVYDHKQIIAGLQNPTESALKSQHPGLIVVLDNVGPGNIKL
jgi:hypothetical protein